MGNECNVGFRTARRVGLVCISVGFLLDVLDHSWAVFRLGLPVTFANIASHAGRPWHGWIFLVSGLVFLACGAYVVGSFAVALRALRDEMAEEIE